MLEGKDCHHTHLAYAGKRVNYRYYYQGGDIADCWFLVDNR